jgi:hypothetical protein
MRLKPEDIHGPLPIGIHSVAGDVPGFSWRVTKASRSWVLRTTIADARCELGMGGANVPYECAISSAAVARRIISRGIDPRTLKAAAAEADQGQWDFDKHWPLAPDAPFSIAKLAAFRSLHQRRPDGLFNPEGEPFKAAGDYSLLQLAAGDIVEILERLPRANANRARTWLEDLWTWLEQSGAVSLPSCSAFFREVDASMQHHVVSSASTPRARSVDRPRA